MITPGLYCRPRLLGIVVTHCAGICVAQQGQSLQRHMTRVTSPQPCWPQMMAHLGGTLPSSEPAADPGQLREAPDREHLDDSWQDVGNGQVHGTRPSWFPDGRR